MSLEAMTLSPSGSDQNDLNEKLARFGVPAADLAGARDQLIQTPPERLAIILREIDEIVLPRYLEILVDHQLMAQLYVAHRRLKSIRLDQAQADQDLTPSTVADHLRKLVQSEGKLSLCIARPDGSHDGVAQDISVRKLRQALNVEADTCAIDRLVRQFSPTCDAMLTWQDQEAPGHFEGDASFRPAVEKLAATYRLTANQMGSNKAFGEPQAQGIAIPVNAHRVIVLARLGAKGVAAALPMTDGLQAIEAWQLSTS